MLKGMLERLCQSNKSVPAAPSANKIPKLQKAASREDTTSHIYILKACRRPCGAPANAQKQSLELC